MLKVLGRRRWVGRDLDYGSLWGRMGGWVL